jgi:hypothetical protein
MAEYQIGDNLYADTQGKYYRLNNGQKTYEESPFDGYSTKINSLYDSQRKNQLDALKVQRDKAVSGFNQQKKELAPKYQNQRNQADVVNAQNVARLRELMAAQGINASGENLTTQAGMASARQSALGEITNNEETAYRDIDRQIADVNDPSKEQAIVNEIETARTSRLAEAHQQAQQEIYERYLEWRNYQMQQQAAAEAASRARSSGGSGGSSRKKSSSSKSTSSKATTTTSAPTVATTNQSALDQYYSSPAIQAVERLKSMSPNNYALNKAFDAPVAPAQNPNLSAWAKMRMFGK